MGTVLLAHRPLSTADIRVMGTVLLTHCPPCLLQTLLTPRHMRHGVNNTYFPDPTGDVFYFLVYPSDI